MSPIAGANEPFGDRYKIIEKIGEGSYSEVLKCKKRDTGDIYACKRLKHNYKGWKEVDEIAEIRSLRNLIHHPNILQMTEVHFDPTVGRVCLVFELMDKNLYELIKDRKRLLSESRVKIMMFQLIRALRHLHKHGIFHRDVKPENILLRVNNDLLKLGDLGSVRGLFSKPPYTEYISTRWYRSPECLLTAGHYGFKMDIWAAGCVFYEIMTLRPLFPGSSELDQINRIHNILGAPPQRILQKFCSHAEIVREYAPNSSKKTRFESIKKILTNFKSGGNSKSRNFDWYFAPNKEASGVDRLLPAHITLEARDLLRQLLQYDPESRPSSHRLLQHNYFNDLRDKSTIIGKEFPADDGSRPIVTIVGDPQGAALAMAEMGCGDLGKLGDHKMKNKLRRLEDSKKTHHKPENLSTSTNKPTGVATMGLSPSTVAPLRDENKSSIPKKISVTEDVLKSKHSALPVQLFNKDENQDVHEKSSFKYKYPPIEKLHIDSKGRDADVDTPVSSIKNQSNNIKSQIPEPKFRKSFAPQLLSRHPVNSNLDAKSSIMSISQSIAKAKESEFPRAFIDKTKLNSDRIQKINDNRAMVQLEPIGGTDIKRSVLASDIPQSSYFTRSLAKANKEVTSVKHIHTQLMPLKTQREPRPTVIPIPDLVIPKPQKLEKNFQGLIKYPNQSVTDARTMPSNKQNLIEPPRRRSNIGNTQTIQDHNQYYGDVERRGMVNSNIPIKSEIPTLPKLPVMHKPHRSWVDEGVRADANPIQNDLRVGKLPVIKKQDFTLAQPNKYDEDHNMYESSFYNQKANASLEKSTTQKQYTRPNNSEDPTLVLARRRRRSDLTYTKQGVIDPSKQFNIQGHNRESLVRNVDISAMLAQQQLERRMLLDGRQPAIVQSNSYRNNEYNGKYSGAYKKIEGEQPTQVSPVYFSKEAKLLHMANSMQRQRVNAPTGDQPQTFIQTLQDRERDKQRQLASIIQRRKIPESRIENIDHRHPPQVEDSSRPPPGPRRLKPTVQVQRAEVKAPPKPMVPADMYRSESLGQTQNMNLTNQFTRNLETLRSNKNIDSNSQLQRDLAKLRAARNDDVFFSSDDDALNLMREKVGSIINERASQRASEKQTNPKNVDSDEDPQNLRLRYVPGKRMRRELRPREPVQAPEPVIESWNGGQLLRDRGKYQEETPRPYHNQNYQHHRVTQENKYYNAENSHHNTIPSQLRSRIPLAQGQLPPRGQIYTPPSNKPTYLSSPRMRAGIPEMSLAHGRNAQPNNTIMGMKNLNRSVYKDKTDRQR